MLQQLLSRSSERPRGLLDETAGIFITGDPGTGKTVLAREMNRSAAESGAMAVFHLDPEAEGVEDSLRDVSDMGQSVRDRVHHFYPADPKLPIGAINMLHVDRNDYANDYEYEARLECRASLAAHMAINVFGQDSFDNAAQLYRNLITIFRSAARMNLTMPDGFLFLDVGSDFYHTLTAHVGDPLAQAHFRRVASLRPDRQKEALASTWARMIGLFSSPVVTAHLGCAEHTVPVRQLIDSQALVYINLSQGEEILSREAQMLLANIWLSEIFHVIFTTPREKRKPVLIICDELPVFRASAPLITAALKRTRKRLCRFVGLAQGTQAFPLGTDDPLLHAMTSCANAAIFRHSDPVDCEYFGRFLNVRSRDPKRVKYEHRELQQYQAGTELTMLVNRAISDAYSDAEGEGGSAGISSGTKEDASWQRGQDQAHTKTTGTNASGTKTAGTVHNDQQADSELVLSNAFDAARRRVTGTADGRTNSQAQTAGTSESDAKQIALRQSRGGSLGKHIDTKRDFSWSRQRVHQHSNAVSYVQQIVPIYAWREIVRVELMALDEQDKMKETEIARQDTGQAFFYTKGQPVLQGMVEMTRDWLADTPEFAAEQIARLLQETYQAPFYRLGSEIMAERHKVIELVVEHLRTLPALNQSVPLIGSRPQPSQQAGWPSPGLVVDDGSIIDI